MANSKSWMGDVPWLCCCVCAVHATECSTIYITQLCAHLVCGKCQEDSEPNCCPKCRVKQVQYAPLTTDIQNSPFSNFFSDIKPFSDQLQKALEFQNKHFLESCAREKEVKSGISDVNETATLEHKVKQMKGWKKRAVTSCKSLDTKKKALLDICRQSELPVPMNFNEVLCFTDSASRRALVLPNAQMTPTSRSKSKLTSLGPPPCPPPVPSHLKKLTTPMRHHRMSPMSFGGRVSHSQSKSQGGSRRGLSTSMTPRTSLWQQPPSPMDTTTAQYVPFPGKTDATRGSSCSLNPSPFTPQARLTIRGPPGHWI